MDTVIKRNRPLPDLLSRAASSELDVLADLLTDNGKGRVALSAQMKARILDNKRRGSLQSISSTLAREIRCFAGHTLVNAFRDQGVDYRDIAAAVAMRMGASVCDSDDVFAIEQKVIICALEMHPNGSGKHLGWEAQSAVLTEVVRDLINSKDSLAKRILFGSARRTPLLGGASRFIRGSPLAVSFTVVALGAAAVYTAQKPAFRITVPAVIQIANIRRGQYEAEFESYTRSLRACL